VTGVSRGGNHIVPYQPSGLWPYPSERETQKTIAPSAIAKREATTEISEMIKDNNQNKRIGRYRFSSPLGQFQFLLPSNW
jgi:hypothetical protein